MAIEVTWLGHASWLVDTGRHKILIDPFLADNPAAPTHADQVNADFVLISHGHFDHVADAARIANKNDALLISNYEICQWFAKNHGVKNTLGMNLGGSAKTPFGRVKLTLAFHSSELPDGAYGGNPCGFLLTLDDPVAKIYLACDTALFGDMKRIGEVGLDLAILPIGDVFTMGPDDALEAVKLLQPQRVVPSHFNTWPPIAVDAAAWAARVRQETSTLPTVLEPGQKIEI